MIEPLTSESLISVLWVWRGHSGARLRLLREAQAPGGGVPNMIDPPLHAGVELPKADAPRLLGIQPVCQMPGAAAYPAHFHQAMVGIDLKARPRNARGHGRHLVRPLMDRQAQGG